MIPDKTYRVVRYYRDRPINTVIFANVSLEVASHWCRDNESCSDTCKLGFNKNHTEVHGPWFDGYEEEE